MKSSSNTFAFWEMFTLFDLIWIEQLEVGLKKGLFSSSSEANNTGKFLEFLFDDEDEFPCLKHQHLFHTTSSSSYETKGRKEVLTP